MILVAILALALTSAKAPIIGNFVVCSVDWAFSLLWLLWWHSTEIWVPKPNTNQHDEPMIWVTTFVGLQYFSNLELILVIKIVVAS